MVWANSLSAQLEFSIPKFPETSDPSPPTQDYRFYYPAPSVPRPQCSVNRICQVNLLVTIGFVSGIWTWRPNEDRDLKVWAARHGRNESEHFLNLMIEFFTAFTIPTSLGSPRGLVGFGRLFTNQARNKTSSLASSCCRLLSHPLAGEPT